MGLLLLLLPGVAAPLPARLVAQQPAQLPATPPGASLATERRLALDAYDAGRTQEAAGRLQALAGRLPGDFAVQEALGLLLAEAGTTAAALAPLRAAAALEPGNAAARANYGAALLQARQAAPAVQELSAAARLEPANAQTAASLGRAQYLDHMPGEAAATLARASRELPDDADLRYDWILALAGSHQEAQALEALDSTAAAQRTPALESLWGDVAERAGQYTVAVAHMKTAAQQDPSEANLYALTVEFLRHWTWTAAGQIADFGLSRYPGSQRLRFAKGVALFGNTQFPAAATLFAALLQGSPDDASYADLLGRSCAALGGGQSAACEALRRFAKTHPANARASLFAAISILHAPDSEQHLQEAEALLRGSLEHDTGSSQAWYQLGVLQQQRGDWAGSEQSLRKAIALRPSYAEAHYRLFRAYAHEGHKEEAMAELAKQREFAAEEKQQSDARLKEVTVFLTDAR